MLKNQHKYKKNSFIEAHRTIKPSYLMVMVVGLLMIFSMNFILAATWDNVKNEVNITFDNIPVKGNNLLEKYPPIKIINAFGLGETLFEGYLSQHDDVCIINCKSTIEIKLHDDGVLIDDVTFKTLQNDGSWIEQNFKNYQFRYFKEGRWIHYDVGEEVKAGIYTLELKARKNPTQTIDWIIKTQGKILDEWAIWGAGSNIVSYYQMDESSGNVLDSTSNNFHGTNYGATRNVDGILNKAFSFDGANDVVNLTTFDMNTSNAFSISVWINATNISGGLSNDKAIVTQANNTAEYSVGAMDNSNGDLRLALRGNNDTEYIASYTWEELNTWNHVVGVYNGTHVLLYLNGVLRDFASTGGFEIRDLPNTTTTWMIGSYNNDATRFFNGTIDEVGFWNRSLTTAEISELYNSGSGLAYSGTSFSVTLNQPENDTSQTENVNFNATLYPTQVNITNATLQIWNSTDSLIYENTTTYTNQNTEINVNLTVLEGNFSFGTFYWNFEGCYENETSGVHLNCTYADNNYTFEWIPFSIDAENHSSPVLETSLQEFNLTVSTVEGYSVQNGRLVYNGTIHDYADKTDLGSDNYFLTKSIYIPQGVAGFSSENRTFYWNLTIVNEETGGTTNYISSIYNQTVNELLFGLCGGDYDIPMLNFTLYNEETGAEINATANNVTFQGTFNLGGTYQQLLKSYSINNLSVNTNEFDFCTGEEDNIIYCDMELFFSAQAFTDKDYFLNNATLTNNTNEIALYLLNETNALEFFISVKRNLIPLPYVTVNVEKYFVGEGVYKTVEIDETGVDGDFTSYLDLDKKYRFTIYEENVLISSQIKKASCEAAPCTITLTVTEEEEDILAGYYAAYAQNVLYNLSYNGGTKIVTFDFIDTTGLANYFRMEILKGFTNQSSQLIYEKILYTSSGQMTYNMSNYTDGDFTVNTYLSRSPDSFIDFITFTIEAIAGALGFLGLFLSLILILVIIFGFSFKPSMFIMAVPLALSIGKLMGLVSLSSTALISIYIIGGVAVVFLSR